MSRVYNFVLLSVAAVLLCAARPAFGQAGASAGIYGSVTDSQGAVIPGAKVTLLQVATNQARTATANEAGEFLFPLLAVGEYQISVEQPGFKKYEQTGLRLQVNDNVKVDVRLEVGEVSTQVVVESTAATVETSNATIKEVVDSRRVVDLPLNGRNLADLTLLVPGVQPVGAPNGDAGLNSYSAPGVKALSVNGSRQNQIKYTLDGGDNSDNLFNGNMAFPFPDAVQEFSMVTSNAGLEVGKSSAGTVNIVTKSGTNQIHGDAFEFIRNTDLNANDFFSRFPDGLQRNQGGVTAGGPIIKNKLFLFAGYQRTWLRQVAGNGSGVTMAVPFRTGDFSTLGTVIKDPQTGQPFPGNIIPQSRFSPAAQNLLQFTPPPGPDGLVHYSLRTTADTSDYVTRGDYRINDHHSIVARFFQEDYNQLTPMVPNDILTVRTGIDAPTTSATLGYTYVVSPSLVSDTHISVAREVGNRTMPFPKSIADLGVAIHPQSNEINLHLTGASGLNLSTNLKPAEFARTNIELTHSWQWIHGRHSVTWGGELMFSRYNEYNPNSAAGIFQFNGRYTGSDQADYILGLMSSFRQGNGEIEFRRIHYQGFYGGDTFRVTPRLTLNFGLRWEPFTPLTDLLNRQDQFIKSMYQAGVGSPHFVNAPAGTFYPGDKLPNGYVVPKAGTEGSFLDISPRFGFAYDLKGDGKTSIRGGYGLFYDTPETWMYNNMNDYTPFAFSVRFSDGYFDDPYAGRRNLNIFPYSGDFNPKIPYQLPFNFDSLEHQMKPPYTQNWNLTIERKLGSDWLLRVGYVGTKTTHLMIGYDQNAPIYNFSQTLSQNLDTIDQRRPLSPLYGYIFTMGHPLGQFYNGLEVSINKRFTRGFSVLGSYTWSKNLDYVSSNNDLEDSTIQSPFNFNHSRGPADSDHPQRFVGSFVWDLPDPGKPTGLKLLSAVFGNWQMSGIETLQSGRPFTVFSSGDRSGGAACGGNCDSYGDLTGNLSLTGGSRGQQIAQYFNTSAVAQAAPGTFGTLGRNILRGPNFKNTDLSVARSFPLPFREGLKIQFRTEFFNLFNRPDLGQPNATIGNRTFGVITSTTSNPRILQMSLKVEF
ncbi:MAG TPA: carboxypeptidase regulatory-like domain-containing protein [Bryobacterales bacterium]|nr:carboxypeptidase regulatory-like domain-containing protein [Bryobacterales bacterium]